MEPHPYVIKEPDEVEEVRTGTPKPKPVRSRHDPVGDNRDLVDRALKTIKAKDEAGFKVDFARRLGYVSVEAMDRAFRRAERWNCSDRRTLARMPSHIALKIGSADLLSQALVRRLA